jgi:hypothetical protein
MKKAGFARLFSLVARLNSGQKKSRNVRDFSEQPRVVRLGSLNVGSLLAFGALRDFELDFLTFFEGLEAIHLDRREVSKQILTAVVRSNETKTFGVIEPFDCTCCHKSVFLILSNHTSRKSKKPRVTAAPSYNLLNPY